MKKLYLILLLLCCTMGALYAKPYRGVHNNSMPPCDTPKVNPDTLLLQYLSHEPLSATGGTSPYTYSFSPDVSTSELINPPDTNITYTITVTGANGCPGIYHAHFIALKNISSGSCTTLFMSEYIQDTVNHDDAIELYNPTPAPVNLSSYYLAGTNNRSLLTPFLIALHGTIAAHSTFLIANTHADTSLTHKANMLSDSLSFGGLDIVVLAQISISVPNITFSFLDEVGSIAPLPADSGWVVGSGSTKNHTLIRQTSVTQGSTNWITCRTQWNVYPRGTFSHIGTYSNVCTPEDPNMYLSLSDPSVTCGEPSYFYFDVLIQADSPVLFDYTTFDITYPYSEFAGDNVHISGIDVERGADFPYTADNQYDITNTQANDSTINITIGNRAAVDGLTTIDSLPRVLFRVRMQITNSCAGGTIHFTDTSGTSHLSYFTNEDSTFSHTEITRDTFRVVFDSCDPCSVCDSLCCTWDSLGNCTKYCYITKDTAICPDTIWHYRIDSIYSYTFIGNVPFGITYYDDGVPTMSCPMNMDPTNTPINAGTTPISIPYNSSALSITGTGFGAEKDSILVSNANGPGMCKLDAMDILSWTENKIIVRMPSFLQEDTNLSSLPHTPGTGPIQVFNACGGSSESNLRINYNIEDDYQSYTKEKTRLDITMSTSMYSLVFRCDTSVTNNARAYACVKKAVRTWNCYTGVNWIVGPSIMLDTTLPDGISNIYFSHSNTGFHASSTLMVTSQQPEEDGYCYDSKDSMAFYDEADIKMRLDKYLPSGKHWNYDTTYSSASDSFYYFYDVILHELGHAHGLGHINDIASLMNVSTSPGRRDSIPGGSYYPGPATLYGAFDVINTGIGYNPASLFGHCVDNQLVNDTKECIDHKLSVSNIPNNPFTLTLYPNPIGYGTLTIAYTLASQSDIGFKIYDCTGRLIMDLGDDNKPPGTYNEQANTTTLAQGIYLFTAIINGQCKTIKFVKL